MANSFNINGVIYENIGILTINGNNYILIQNEQDIKIIEAKKVDNDIKYSYPDMNTDNIQNLKGSLICEELVEGLKKDIKAGNITTKEELQKQIADIQKTIDNNEDIKNLLAGTDINEFKDKVKNIYAFFDKEKTLEPDLNMEGITSFQIEKDGVTNEYIKKYDEQTGEVEILKNRDDKNFVEQFKETQEEYSSLRSDDGELNAERTFDMMKEYSKEEVKLEKMDDIKKAETKDEVKSYHAINSNAINNNERDMMGDLSTGIYVDANSGDTMTTQVDGNTVSVNKVVEQEAINNVITDEFGEEHVNAEGVQEEDLTSDEIKRLLLRDELTEEQRKHFEEMLQEVERKEQEREIAEKALHPDKRLELKLNNKPDNRAAYISIITLCLFTQIFLLLGILAVVYFMK